jgi:UDP-N-acetylglucosamine 1-carboxyvinyltransferase
MVAALLASGPSEILGAADVNDTRNLGLIMAQLGARVQHGSTRTIIATAQLRKTVVEKELSARLRTSIIVLGALLARFGRARVGLPGGCAIGPRPIDQHIKGLEALGANIKVEDGYVLAHAPNGLHGATVIFDIPTVTGTINLILPASLAVGETTLFNAAMEPEVEDVGKCIISMGGDIEGLGTNRITIRGQKELRPCRFRVMRDRIECGNLIIAGSLAGDHLKINGYKPEHHAALICCLKRIGVKIRFDGDACITICRPAILHSIDFETGPHPAFPTDMQPLLMVLLSIANGVSKITENVYPHRFRHAVGLSSLGAKVKVSGNRATISGVSMLSGSVLEATDLRAAACLLLAALVADEETVILGVEGTLDRGYERLDLKLAHLGASVTRIRSSFIRMPNGYPAGDETKKHCYQTITTFVDLSKIGFKVAH